MRRAIPLLLLALAVTTAPQFASAQHDWPMAGHDAARTGLGAQSLRGPYSEVWTRKFGDTRFGVRINEDVQVVSVGDLAYVGTEGGELHALNVADGTTAWMRQLPSVISNSACVYDGLVIQGCQDGVVYAFDAATGTPAWQYATGAGIWSAPCAADGKVFVTSKDGCAYGLEAKTGKFLWKGQTGRPIYFSPAYADGRVYVGSDDMHAYCFDATTGEQIWKSEKLPGESFRDWWPVVIGEVVFFNPQPLRANEARASSRTNWPPRDADYETKRQTMVEHIIENRAVRQICIALKTSDGAEAYVVPANLNGGANHPQIPVFLMPDGSVGMRNTLTREQEKRSTIVFMDPATGKFTGRNELAGGMQVNDESGGYGSACGWYVMMTQAVWGQAWDARTGRPTPSMRGAGWHEGGAGTVASGQYYQAPHSAANGRIFMIYPAVVRCFEPRSIEEN